MTTTPEQRTKLKAAAEAATPGPWEARENSVIEEAATRHDSCLAVLVSAGTRTIDEAEANAAFIALANPETILALLAEIESLEARVASAEGDRYEARRDRENAS